MEINTFSSLTTWPIPFPSPDLNPLTPPTSPSLLGTYDSAKKRTWGKRVTRQTRRSAKRERTGSEDCNSIHGCTHHDLTQLDPQSPPAWETSPGGERERERFTGEKKSDKTAASVAVLTVGIPGLRDKRRKKKKKRAVAPPVGFDAQKHLLKITRQGNCNISHSGNSMRRHPGDIF